MIRHSIVAVSLLFVACSRSPTPELIVTTKARPPAKPAMDAEFWRYWGDGQAEVSSYDIVVNRYGQPRKGLAVAIFVTEPFSNTARVKADPGRHADVDVFPVIKLNLLKKYQTGVYDYSDMLSVFVSLAAVNNRSAGVPAKISFSSQEWCGHVYSQALLGPRFVHADLHSYFDGEADQRMQLRLPPNGVSEDGALLWARSIAQPRLKPGMSAVVPALKSLESVRMKHLPLSVGDMTFSVAPKSSNVVVPAGKFETLAYTARAGGFTRTFYVEATAPYRVIRWETSEGEQAQLRASDRMKYWELNAPSGEAALSKLGLEPKAAGRWSF
jgi:hypothetical protein